MTSYRESGVDLEAAAEAVSLIKDLARDVARPEVVDSVGGFAGLFRIGEGRLLAAATDGVGTKTEVARMTGRLDTIGIDLVAMCADDVVCTGAEPLFFLDYVAVGKLEPAEVASLVEGVGEGCRRARCALLGGETAEHPGAMEPGQFDLAGFCVGIVDESLLLGSHRVRRGDVLIGLPSSGLHSNGYSLARKALLDAHPLDWRPPELDGKTIGDALLEPTRIYAKDVLALLDQVKVKSLAHVTGGGLPGNVPRTLPDGTRAVLDERRWPRPAIFELVQREGGVPRDDMFLTFNMGLGLVAVLAPPDVAAAQALLASRGLASWVVGGIEKGAGEATCEVVR